MFLQHQIRTKFALLMSRRATSLATAWHLNQHHHAAQLLVVKNCFCHYVSPRGALAKSCSLLQHVDPKESYLDLGVAIPGATNILREITNWSQLGKHIISFAEVEQAVIRPPHPSGVPRHAVFLRTNYVHVQLFVIVIISSLRIPC